MTALLVVVLLGTAGQAYAEYDLEYGFAASEEYNDNVYLSPDNPQEDFITRIIPSAHAFYNSPLWQWDVSYAFDYRYYADGTRNNDTTHRLLLTNRTYLVRNFLFLDIKDDYRRVSLDPIQDYTLQSLFVNQTDRNELVVSPYIRVNLTTQTTGTLGYQYRNIWHKQRSATNISEHREFIDLIDELSPRTRLTAGMSYTRIDAEHGLGYDVIDVYAGPRYEYSEDSWLWVILGNSTFRTGPSDQEVRGNQPFWEVGVAHRFLYYTLTLNTALSYVDDPGRIRRREDRYIAVLRRESDRTRLELNAGRWEYRDILTKHLQNTRNGIGGVIGYALTPALNGAYSLNIDHYEDDETNAYYMLYLNLLRLDYALSENAKLSLEYRFQHGYSPDAQFYNMNYDNNRVTLAISRVF